MEFDRYTVVILRRPPDATRYSDEELDAIQQRHLAFNADLQDRGIMLAAGPFEDQWDESYRGISIYRTDLEETRRLAAEDPAVLAHRLTFDAVTWLTRKGQLEPEK
ncbi:MAG: YciI family protein [Actinomycetota bacterium]